MRIIVFVFFLVEEGDGMPQEEKLPEDSKNSSPNPASSLSPASGNPISPHTTVTRNFSQSVPGTSSSAFIGTKSPPKSSPPEVTFQMEKKSEGIYKSSDSQPMCLSFPLRFPCPTTSPESVSHWRECQN